MARLHVRRIAYALGAEVTGLDLREPLDDATVAELRAAWLEHLLLCFPNQALDGKHLVAFAKSFGELEPAIGDNPDPQTPHVGIMTEQPINGKPWQGYKSGQTWHSDKTFTTRPTSATIVACKQIPEVGGDTMFANMYMAYDALSPTMQGLIGQLSGIHHRSELRTFPGASGGIDPRSPEEIQRWIVEREKTHPPVVQPVVRTHAETNRKSLFFSDRVRRFIGMTEDESRPLADFIRSHAVRYEFTYRHRWTVNDLIMWDNRCTMHMALCDYDLRRDPRYMMRTAVKGEPLGHEYRASEEAQTPSGVAQTAVPA
jgi:taurine dioxygenase